MSNDVRGWHIALVPPQLINPPGTSDSRSDSRRDSCGEAWFDAFDILNAAGYGLLQLPPEGNHGLLLAVIVEQVVEYMHHGYAVVAVGIEGAPEHGLHWRRFASLLRHRATAVPPRHVIALGSDIAREQQALREFLSRHDVSADEQRRWRG